MEYNAKVDAYNASMERIVECVREMSPTRRRTSSRSGSGPGKR